MNMIEIVPRKITGNIHLSPYWEVLMHYQGLNYPDKIFVGLYSECVEFVHQLRERKIRKHRMQRRRNKLYRLHPEFYWKSC
jgi:hypothetical protein